MSVATINTVREFFNEKHKKIVRDYRLSCDNRVLFYRL